jgi:hypothetical protein
VPRITAVPREWTGSADPVRVLGDTSGEARSSRATDGRAFLKGRASAANIRADSIPNPGIGGSIAGVWRGGRRNSVRFKPKRGLVLSGSRRIVPWTPTGIARLPSAMTKKAIDRNRAGSAGTPKSATVSFVCWRANLCCLRTLYPIEMKYTSFASLLVRRSRPRRTQL